MFFNYGYILNKSIQNVLYQVLKHVSENGLPDGHHFIITFSTKHKGVIIPDYVRNRYPDHMSIVLEHEFEDLIVNKNYISVVLSFSGNKETIKIPFDALIDFSDPYAKFSLQFNTDDNMSLDEDLISFDLSEDSAVLYANKHAFDQKGDRENKDFFDPEFSNEVTKQLGENKVICIDDLGDDDSWL